MEYLLKTHTNGNAAPGVVNAHFSDAAEQNQQHLEDFCLQDVVRQEQRKKRSLKNW